MTYRFKSLVSSILLAVVLCVPAIGLTASAYADPLTYPNDSQSTNQSQTQPNDSQGDRVIDKSQQGTVPQNSGNAQLDTTDRSHDPMIKTDHGKDYGDYLKGGVVDTQSLREGYAKSRTWVRVVSLVVGWLISLLFILIVLTNTLGLFYVAIPVGFIRNFLSGGLYGKSTGMQSNGQVMGGMMGSAPNTSMGSTAQGSNMRMFRVVPSSAIQAVELAESGGSTQGSSPMGNPMGAMGMMQGTQRQNTAPMVSPIRYYLSKQLWEMVALGFAVVVLVLSSVLPDSGITLGNGFVQVVYWALSYLV